MKFAESFCGETRLSLCRKMDNIQRDEIFDNSVAVELQDEEASLRSEGSGPSGSNRRGIGELCEERH